MKTPSDSRIRLTKTFSSIFNSRLNFLGITIWPFEFGLAIVVKFIQVVIYYRSRPLSSLIKKVLDFENDRGSCCMIGCDILLGMSNLEARVGVGEVEKSLRLRMPMGPGTDADSLEILFAAAGGMPLKERKAWLTQALAAGIYGDGNNVSGSVYDLGGWLEGGWSWDAVSVSVNWNRYQGERNWKMEADPNVFRRMEQIAREHFHACAKRDELAQEQVQIGDTNLRLEEYAKQDRTMGKALEAFRGMADDDCGTPLWVVALLSSLEVYYILAARRLFLGNPPRLTTGRGGLAFRPELMPVVGIEKARELVKYAREATGLGDYF